jgi:hypothetical protein
MVVYFRTAYGTARANRLNYRKNPSGEAFRSAISVWLLRIAGVEPASPRPGSNIISLQFMHLFPPYSDDLKFLIRSFRYLVPIVGTGIYPPKRFL